MKKSVVASSSMLVVVSILLGANMAEPIRCNAVETAEAEQAFKNCVESAQSSIITKAAGQDKQSNLCNALDNMLSVCQSQTDRLADCKGQEHAENVKKLHLSATADIVNTINPKAEVEKCSVFTKKTHSPAFGNGQGEDSSPESERQASSASLPPRGCGLGLLAVTWAMMMNKMMNT